MSSLSGEVLVNVVMIMSVILAGISIVYRGKFNSKEKVFSYFLIITGITEILGWTSVYKLKVDNNLPLLHLYTLLEFICIALFASANLKLIEGLPAKVILIAGSSFIIANSIWIQSIYSYNSISSASVKLFTIAMSIIFFYKILSIRKYSISETRPTVYFFTAIFLSACTSMIWYMYSNELMELKLNQWKQLSMLKNVSSLMASILILSGLYYAIVRKEDDII